MAEYTIVPLLHAQNLSVANMAHMANILPETSQALAGQFAVNLLRQEAKQVQKTDKSVKSPTISDEEPGSGLAGDPGLSKKRQGTEPFADDQDPGQSDNPLVGNLLNLKI